MGGVPQVRAGAVNLVGAQLRALVIGNSDGIGLALTRRLIGEGWTVTGVSRRASPIVDSRYDHAVLDVTAVEYQSRLRALHDRRGPFDVCVYCAGVGEPFDPNDLSEEANVFRVNLVGVAQTGAVVLPPMIERSGGHFVALSSIGDEAPSAYAPSYAASKAGLSSYLAGLALALRPRGVVVSNVRLGFVDTKMAKSKIKPLMIPVEEAVDVIARCLARPRARVTYPWRMAVIARVLRWVVFAKLRLGKPRAIRKR